MRLPRSLAKKARKREHSAMTSNMSKEEEERCITWCPRLFKCLDRAATNTEGPLGAAVW